MTFVMCILYNAKCTIQKTNVINRRKCKKALRGREYHGAPQGFKVIYLTRTCRFYWHYGFYWYLRILSFNYTAYAIAAAVCPLSPDQSMAA